MAKSFTTRYKTPRRRRHRSLSGFLDKILPSRRPEQGGTIRSQDATGDNDSAYSDLGINPNELTGWNLAKPQSPKLDATQVKAEDQQKNCSRSTQHERTKLDDGSSLVARLPRLLPNVEIVRLPKRPSSTPLPRSQYQKTRSMTRQEVSRMLKAKEDSRRHRLDLKASGDWLGVQGADPSSGEFAVLTPTSTISTDSTPPSTRERLAELTWKQETAKLTYERAKLEAERAREKDELKKGRLRLAKMEKAKNELRRQQREFPTWKRHKGVWSSATQPGLSPVPQSRGSIYKTDGNRGDTTQKPGPDSNEAAAGATHDTNEPKRAETIGKFANTVLPKVHHRRTRSTETIVRKPLPKIEYPNTSMKGSKNLNPILLANTDDAPNKEHRNEKRFLWRRRRRRMTDPGKQIKRRRSLVNHHSAGTADQHPVLIPIKPPSPVTGLQPWQMLMDHFSEVLIPDHRLHLVPSLDQVESKENSVTPLKCDLPPVPLESPAKTRQRNVRNKHVLWPTTNNSQSPEYQTNSQKAIVDAKEAPATALQSKLKGDTKSPTYQRVNYIRQFQSQHRPMRVSPQTQKTSKTWGYTSTGIPEKILYTQDIQKQSLTLERSTIQSPKMPLPKKTLTSHPRSNLNKCFEEDLIGSVSTRTITIIGCGPDREHLPAENQQHLEALKEVEVNTKSIDAPAIMPSTQNDEVVLCDAAATEQQWDARSLSLPVKPSSGWRSFELPRKIRKPDTILTGLVGETDSTPLARHIQAKGSSQDVHDVSAKGVGETLLQDADIGMNPPQLLDANKSKNTPLREHDVNRAELPVPIAHQHRMPGEYVEVEIHETPRNTMSRSPVTEVVAAKSHDELSLETQDHQEASADVPSGDEDEEATTTREMDDAAGGDGGNSEFSSTERGPKDSRSSSPQQHTGSHTEEQEDKDDCGNDPLVALSMLVFVLVLVYLVIFDLAKTWALPALDRRGRWRKNTWGHLGVVVSACVFFSVGFMVVRGVVRTAWWVVSQL